LVFLGWGFAAHAADPQLVEELRKGGYVLYLRHSSTDFSRNDAIASHGNPYMAVFGAPYLAEGEISVIRPGGKTAFEVTGRIRLEDWATLQP